MELYRWSKLNLPEPRIQGPAFAHHRCHSRHLLTHQHNRHIPLPFPDILLRQLEPRNHQLDPDHHPAHSLSPSSAFLCPPEDSRTNQRDIPHPLIIEHFAVPAEFTGLEKPPRQRPRNDPRHYRRHCTSISAPPTWQPTKPHSHASPTNHFSFSACEKYPKTLRKTPPTVRTIFSSLRFSNGIRCIVNFREEC